MSVGGGFQIATSHFYRNNKRDLYHPLPVLRAISSTSTTSRQVQFGSNFLVAAGVGNYRRSANVLGYANL